jgi:hypothetical protein
MKALTIHAGPRALKHLQTHGLKPEDIRVVPAAAGGPKGLILNPLDQWLFGDWFARSTHEVHCVGASIGAWRMATAAMQSPAASFKRLAHDYIHQEYAVEPGKTKPTARHISAKFGGTLKTFFGAELQGILAHPRYRLHVVTSRGRHVLAREGKLRTPVGYLGAYLTNVASRRAMGAWLERVVFSSGAALPFGLHDFKTRQVKLTEENFNPAVQASCSIPFVLQAVHDIPGAPCGAYWDGGITDYHLHLNYAQIDHSPQDAGLVLYPHFQPNVVPGWLDKSLTSRHKSTAALDNLILLSPTDEWIKALPNQKLPDRIDFTHYGANVAARAKAWLGACSASQQLADEFASMVERQDFSAVKPLL